MQFGAVLHKGMCYSQPLAVNLAGCTRGIPDEGGESTEIKKIGALDWENQEVTSLVPKQHSKHIYDID